MKENSEFFYGVGLIVGSLLGMYAIILKVNWWALSSLLLLGIFYIILGVLEK